MFDLDIEMATGANSAPLGKLHPILAGKFTNNGSRYVWMRASQLSLMGTSLLCPFALQTVCVGFFILSNTLLTILMLKTTLL